jgi:ABC-type amino acid transport substrate-binding protein
MKRTFLLALFMNLACILQAEKAVVGVFLHYPNVYQDEISKEVKGAGIDYIKDVLGKMGYTSSIVLLPFPRIIESLQTGNIDLTFELIKTEERKRFIYYPDKPALIFRPSLTFRSDNNITAITSVNDLRGMTIGYLPNSVIPNFLNAPGVFKFEYIGGDDWIKQNLGKLIHGRIDAALDQNPYSYIAAAKQEGIIDKIKVLSIPDATTDAYVVFSKKSKLGLKLLSAYNAVVENCKSYELYIKRELDK